MPMRQPRLYFNNFLNVFGEVSQGASIELAEACFSVQAQKHAHNFLQSGPIQRQSEFSKESLGIWNASIAWSPNTSWP